MTRNEFNAWVADMVYQNTGENISNIIKKPRGERKFNGNVEIFKPNNKDLQDKNYHHYNPKAIINMFMNKDFLYEYEIYKVFPFPRYSEKDSKSLTRAWLSIEDEETFIKIVKQLKLKGYSWN